MASIPPPTPPSVIIAGMVRDTLVVLALIGLGAIVMWWAPGLADRVLPGVMMLLLLVLANGANKSILRRVLRALTTATASGATQAPATGLSGAPPPDVPASPKTGFTGMPGPGDVRSIPPTDESTGPGDLFVGVLVLAFSVGVAAYVAGCAPAPPPRPPTTEEAEYHVELTACRARAREAGAEGLYETCRAEVNARHGVDAGRWRE